MLANGWSSDKFTFTRGTRQGCPLSPRLYALAAEPLAIAIRSHPNIVGHMTKKVSTYADDTLLYLDGSTDALPTALALIKRFGSFSGLKINWDKSQIVPQAISQ